MRSPVTVLLAAALLAVPRLAPAQSDTLPERVVGQAYDAINRCDRKAYYSLFAPVWYHSVLEDSSRTATPQSREKAIHELDPNSWWARCGDEPRTKETNRDSYGALRRMVLGPFVVDAGGPMRGDFVHLDIFEVRHGKIVHEWESDNYASWSQSPSRQ